MFRVFTKHYIQTNGTWRHVPRLSVNNDTGLVEIIELPNHPFFIGVQYHPELKSTVERPAPLFVSFIGAAKDYNEKKGSIKSAALQDALI